jgi:hypothetical protein
VLYAFIILPSSLLHSHHSYAKKQYTNKDSKINAISIQAAQNSLESDCAICDHEYSPYSDHLEFPIYNLIGISNGKECTFHNTLAIANAYFNSSNKGPPSLV